MIRIWSEHIPPSVNEAYRNAGSARDGKKLGRIKTKVLTDWIEAFGWDVNKAMRGQKRVDLPYVIVITIDRSKRHHAADIMNREKVVSDALKTFGVIKDDRLCDSGTVRWGDAQGGMLIEICPI